MSKPTLQEVKEYFKNAKEVICNENKKLGEIFEIDTTSIKYLNKYSSRIVCNSIKNDTSYVSLFHNGQYAEIISYKEPLYQLTAKEIKHAYENPQWLKDTFKECFKTELEVGKWYKRKGELLVWNGGKDTYGFTQNGFFSNTMACTYIDNNEPAPKKEVEEALVKEAIKRGFKEGVHIHRPFWNDLKDCIIDKDNFPEYMDYFYDFRKDYLEVKGFVVYSKGQWAEILTPTYTIAEAESKFNIKIKAV